MGLHSVRHILIFMILISTYSKYMCVCAMLLKLKTCPCPVCGAVCVCVCVFVCSVCPFPLSRYVQNASWWATATNCQTYRDSRMSGILIDSVFGQLPGNKTCSLPTPSMKVWNLFYLSKTPLYVLLFLLCHFDDYNKKTMEGMFLSCCFDPSPDTHRLIMSTCRNGVWANTSIYLKVLTHWNNSYKTMTV